MDEKEEVTGEFDLSRPFYTIPETCEILGKISRSSLYNIIKNDGDLKVAKIGRRSAITGPSLRRKVARITAKAEAA